MCNIGCMTSQIVYFLVTQGCHSSYFCKISYFLKIVQLYETAHNHFSTNDPTSNLSPNLELSFWYSQAIDKHLF